MVFVDTIKRFTVYEQLCVIYHRVRANSMLSFQHPRSLPVRYTIFMESRDRQTRMADHNNQPESFN